MSLPAVFLPYQQRFLRALEAERVVVVEKSRRTGYSWVAAAGATLRAAAAHGSDAFYMSYNLEMAREFIGYVAEWARAVEPLAASVEEYVWSDPDHPEKQVSAYRVTFASGHKVVALPSVPRALRGMQGMVIVDEAGYHDKLEEVLTAAFAMLIWGGTVAIISTHHGAESPFNGLVEDVRGGRRPYALLRTTFDDALADGLYQRICLTTGKVWSAEAEAVWRAEIVAFYGDGADEELFVRPAAARGAWLPGALIEARMADDIPVLRWACEAEFSLWPEHRRAQETAAWCDTALRPMLAGLLPDEPVALGEDFARRGDLTVIWALGLAQNMKRITRFVVELRGVPFEQQRAILFYIADRIKLRALAADATGNGMYLAEVAAQRYGSLVAQVMFSEGWYRENMPPLKAAFEDGLVVIPRDRDVFGDLRAIQLVKGVARVPERTLGDDGRQRHGDAAVALALAYAASRTEAEVFEYRAAPPARLGSTGAASRRWRERPDDEAEDARAAPMPSRDAWQSGLKGSIHAGR